MLSQDKINQLYQWLKEDGADVGTESEFSKWFTADGERGYNNRKQVWQAFKLDGADVGDTYEEFMSLIKSEKPASQPPVETSVADSEPQVTATEAETLQAQPQAAQTAIPLSDDARKRMAMQMEVMKQNQAAYTANTGKIVDDAKRMMQQNPMTEQGRQQAKVGEMQRQLLGEQKPIGLGSGSNSGNKSQQSGQQQANAINTISPTAYGITKKDGKWTTQYMLPTGELTDDLLQVDAAETAARHGRLTQEFLRRMKDNGLDPAKKEDVQKQANMDYFAPLAEAVNGAYDAIKAADDEQDKRFRENIHNSLTYFDDDSFTSELTMRAARQKANFNINAITDKAMSAIPESFRKQYTDNLARYYAQNPDECFGLSPNQAAEESLRKVVHDYAVERRLEALKPKDNAEFFFRKLVEQPLLSPAVFVDAVSSKMVGNKEDSNLNQQAMQQYESQHKAVGLGATVLGMMMDPAMYIGMPVGALAARGTLNLMGRFMLKGASRPIATRYAGMTLAGRLAAGAAGGAGNFATFEGLHEAQRQALYDNNFSAGAILGQTLHGAIMGGSVGWVGPMLGNTVSKINKTIGSTAGKAAVKGTANWAVAPVLEGTIFATPELLSDDNSDKMSIWADNVAMMYGFKLGHALKGIGTGIKEVGDKVSEDYRRYKDTQEYIPDFNREYIVNNWQRNAPSTETVFEEFKKFIHTGKTSLKEHIRNRIRAEENTGINDDERRWLDEHGYEEIKDLFVLKDNKKVVDGNIVTEKPAEDGSDLTALQEFVKDNTIPEALRAKMYYIATGKILPASTIAGYRLDCNNRDGKETYSVTALNSDGNPILTKYYKSKDLAEAYGKDIQRQVELNQIAIAEQKADEKAYKAGVNKTVNDIATRHGVSAEDVVNSINAITSSYGDKAADVVSGLYDVPKEDLLERIGEYISRRHGLTEYEKNILLDFINEVKNNNPGVLVGRDIAMLNEFQAGIQGSVYRQNAGSIRAELSREWGMNVDDAIRKRYDERNKDEHELVQEYLNRLNGAKRKPFRYGEKTNEPDPIGNNGNGAPEITPYGGNMRRAPRGDNNKQPLINDDKHIVEDNKPITEEDKSVIKEEQHIVEQVDPIDPIELEVEAARKKVNDIAHTETGDIQPVTIVDGIDEHPHEAFILQNTVVPDASGNVDRTKSDEMVVVYDNKEGKKKIISTAIIDKVQPTSTVDDTMALEEQIIKQSYQQPQPQQPQPQQPQQPQPQQPIVNNGEQPIQPAIPQAENSAVQPIQQTQEPPVAVNPMQPIEQPVVDNTIQPTIQPAEQPIEQPTEQQPESALARVPVDVDGTPVFTDTEPETAYDAIAEMMDGNEEDRDDIIKQSISNISKQIDTAKKKVSGVKLQGNNYGKFKAEKAAARQQLESLQQQLEKWNAIAGIGQQRAEAAAAEAKAAEEAAKAEVKRLEEERKAAAEAERLRDASRMKIREIEAQLGEPIDMFDYVMRAIGSGAYKFKWGDSNRTTHNTRGLGAHIGLKNSQDERRKRISFLDNKYGYYPEDAALRMLEDYTGNDRDRYTDQDVLNIILDVLQQYDTPRAIMEAAFKRHEAGVDMESAQDAYYEEQYMAEQDRYIAMYEQEAKELSQAATESEINGIFADVLIQRGEYDYGQTGGTEVYGVQNPIPQGQELDGGMPQGTELLPRQESDQRETGEESPAGGSRVDAENVNNGTGNDAARPDADGGRTVGERIASAEADVDTEPTDKQKEAGNYKKGHVKIGSFDVTIENPKGSVRSGVDSNGERWSNTMNNTYGYIRGAIGVDGDHIDVYLSSDIDNWNGEKVYVIDVYNPDGSFDEHKVMLGFNEVTTAKEDFLKNYDASWGNNRRLDVSDVALADFEKWVNSSKRKTKPFSEYKIDRLLYKATTLDEPANSSAEQPVKRGGSLSSESKDSEKGGEKQEDKEGKHEFNIEQTTYTNKLNKTIDVFRVTFNRELSDAERTAMNRIVKQPVVEGKRKTKGWFDFNTGGYMVRSREFADELVKVITDKSGITVKDNQPISNSDVKELLGETPKKKSPINKVNVETLMSSLEKNGVATLSENAEPVEEKPQYECSDEEMNALIKEMRDILGADEDEANSGIHFRDGDTLTKAEKDKLLLVAARLTSAMFERGNTDFDKYCAQMVKVIGDRVRPWLKSFYSFARYSPDNAKYSLSPDEFVNGFDVVGFDNPNTSIFTQADAAVEGKKAEKATIESEKSIIEKRNKLRNEREKQSRVSAAATAEKADAVSREAEAVAKAPTADTKQITDTIGKIDAALDEIDESLALIGYYDSPNAELKAAHDAAIIASRLYRDLGINTGSLQNDFQLSSARFWGEGGVINIRLSFSPDEIGEVCVDMKMQDNRYLPQNINVRRNYPKGYVIGRNTHVLLGGSTYGELLDNIRDLFKDVLPQAKNSVPVEETSVEQQPKSQPGKSKKSSNKPVAGNSQELGGLFSVPANVENNTTKVKKPVLREASELSGDSAEFQQREMQTAQFVEEIGAVISSRVEMLRLDAEAVKPLTMSDVKKIASKYPLLSGISDTDLQELVELAMTQITREAAIGGITGNAEQQREAYDHIVDMYKIQPSLNARDSERLMKQQYSTPTPFGYVMGQFVRAYGKKIGSVLEPSAGNGALTIALDPETVHANDIDEARLVNLRKLGFRTVTAQNGLLPFKGEEVDAVMTNPPFGSVQEKEYEEVFRISSLEGQMAINALDSMKDDGRAAIIIGGNTNYRENGSMNPKDAAFFGYLYSRYNVVDVINISGKALYSRNGTGYDVRMILINGRKGGKFERVYPPVKSKARAEQVTTFDELYKRVQYDIQQILQTGNKPADVQREPERPIDREQSEKNGENGNRANSGRGGRSGRTGSNVGNTPVSDFMQPVQRNAGGRTGRLDNGNGGDAAGSGVVQGTQPGQTVRGISNGSSDNGRGGSGNDGRVVSSPRVDSSRGRLAVKPDLNDEKVEYSSKSDNGFMLMSVVPASQATVLQQSLSEIGDVDSFLVEQLGYSSKEELYGYLAAEQIDSVALAINQMNKGKAFIIGDMTGVGKGRQGAALIRYAVKQGKIPIYFTQKPELFTDNYRDLSDIGSAGLRPFIIASDAKKANIVDVNGNTIHKLPSKNEQERVFAYISSNGKLPSGYDYVLTTYDQIKNGTSDIVHNSDGTNTSKLKEKKNGFTAADRNGDRRREVLMRLAQGNILILDESHTVGGDGGSGRYMQAIVNDADGVTFMSATFAKKAANMPIYAQRTAIADAGIKPDELITAIAKGGVTLQEIMSKQLVESGQMIRRERSFEGVNIDWINVDDETDRKQREQFDEVAYIFDSIRNFQDKYVKPIINSMSEASAERGGVVGQRRGTKDLGVTNPPFASKMYNLVNQLLFALKVDAVSNRVIENLKNGYKPVISFSNTMEGFLEDAQKGVEMDEMPNFSITLMRALDGVMRYTRNDADNNSEGGVISFGELSEEGQYAYNDLRSRIEALSADLPISPMDAIRMRIEEAGYSVSEITGRKLQLNKTSSGKYIVESRKDKDAKKSMRDFNSGKLDVLMINKSGSTGISLHASSKFADQRQRVMVFAQFQSDINDEVQMRGRIDRSGQVARGKYEYIMSTIPAEQRLQMMFKAKLKSLDANTTSSQKSKFNEMEVVDYLNKYGDDVVWNYMLEHLELEERLGDPLKILGDDKDNNRRNTNEDNPKADCAAKISRHLAFLSVKEQDEIFREITEAYKVKMQLLDDAGENDLEITTMPLRAETKNVKLWHRGTAPNTGNAFADNTYVEEVECDVLKKPMKRSEIEEAQRKLMGDLYSEKNGAVDWCGYIRQKNDEISAFFTAKADAAVAKLTENAEAKIRITRNKTLRDGKKARERGENNLTDEQIASLAETAAEGVRQEAEQEQRRCREQIMSVRHRIGTLMQRLNAGAIYVVPQDLTNSTGNVFTQTFGTFVGFKFNKTYTLGSSTAIFATLDGRRKVELALGSNAIDTILQATDTAYRYSANEIHSIKMDNWDSKVPTLTREKRYIVTGNLLQALVDVTKGVGTRGNLISYSTIDGEIRQGILMRNNFKLTDLRNSAPISSRLAQIQRGEAVASDDGDVQISKILVGFNYRNDYELRVPKSKQRGGKYTMNDDLLRLVINNNFVTKGNSMIAYVSPGNISRVVDLLSREPFNVTVLEESKLEDAENNTVEEKAEKYSSRQMGLFGDAKQNPVQLSMFDSRENKDDKINEVEQKANAAIESFAEVYNRYADEEDAIITGDSENPNNSVEAELIQAQNDFKVALTDFYKQSGNSEEDAARMAKDMLAQVRSEVEISRIYLNNAKSRGLNKLDQEEWAKEEQQLQDAEKQQKIEQQKQQKNTCETAGGEAISVESNGGLPKLKRGEFAVVERQFAIDKNFTFDGKAKIESVDDVAYIFRQLESYCVEHAFAMLIKDGKPTIVHLGMGTFSATQVNTGALRAAVDEFGADSVYFIHNHPSGNLKPSNQDRGMHSQLKGMFEGMKIEFGSIIIDTTSGRYTQFDTISNEEREMPKNVDGVVEFPVRSFSRQIFNETELPSKQIKSPTDIAETISTLRLGKRNKIGLLLLNRANQVVGNIFSGFSSYSNAKKMAEVAVKYALHYGAEGVVTYGNVALDGISAVAAEIKRISGNSVRLLDGFNVSNGLNAYDTGAMESGVPYGKGGNEKFRGGEDIEVVNERFNEELQQQIDGTLPKGHIYQLGKPGELLKACGFPDMPIELSATNLAEHSRKSHHIFEIGDIKGLVKELQNPIAAFAYGDKSKSQNVIVEIQKDGKNFLVGVHFNQAKNGIEVSSIRGIFPKNNSEWLNWIAQGKSIYLNKGKIQTLIDQQQKILADVEYLDLDSVAKIVKEFENPSVKAVKNTEEVQSDAENGDIHYRTVDAESELGKKLEAIPDEELVETYRNVQLFADDSIGSPMAYIDKETGEVRTIEGGKWDDSNPQKIRLTDEQIQKLVVLNENGYVIMDGNKSTVLPINKSLRFEKPKNGPAKLKYWLVKNENGDGMWADYNPYNHSIETPLNTQFSTAYKRPNLVVVKCLVPKSELENGFQADYANLPTGAHQWNNGRTLYLSRYSKIVGVLSRKEEARLIDEYWKKNPRKYTEGKKNTDYKCFVPQVRRELERLGYKFQYNGKWLTPDESLALDEKFNPTDVMGSNTPFITDEDIVRVDAKISGKWTAETKQESDNKMAARVQEIADGLNTPVRIVQSEEEMAQLPTYRKRHAKGWFDTATGEVVIVVPNNENMADVENTVAHEIVAHKGLRKLVGEERFDKFLDEVYDNLDSNIKAVIDARVDEQIRNRAKAINEKKGGRISTMPDSEIEALEEREQIIRDTVEEYMAELAGRIGEHGFEKLDKEEKSLWAKIKERVMKFLDAIMKGFNIRGFNLTDKDLAYILYRSWKNLRDKGSLFDIADDITMRYKTGFNERREKFRDGNTPEDNNRRRPRVKKSPKEIADEKIRNIIDTRIATIKESLIGANDEAFNEKMDRIEALRGNIGDLIKAMSAQRRYDYFTVDTVVSLAQKMLESKALDNVSSYEVKRLLGVTRSIVGKTNTIKDIRKLLNIIIDNQLRNLDKMLNGFINTKGTKLSDKGVEVLGELDPETAIIVKTIKKYKDFPVEAYDADGELLPETILYVKNEIIDKMASDDKAIAENAALTYQGLVVARLYSDLINSSKDDERQIRKEMEDTREERKVLEFKKKTIKEAPILDDTALRDCEEKIKTCDDTISSYEDTLIIVKNERISSLVEVLKEVSDIVDGGYNKANEWRERDKERISDIHHNANSDLFGKPEYEHFTADKELTSKITNNFAVRFFLQPLATFDMMMRTFGGNNARGEGYLWNRFMRQWIDATGDEYDGYRECLKIIEDKLGEIFGRKMSYSDLIKYTAKQKPGYVRFYDAGDMRGYKIEHGGLLYMYMADKMFDGRMKLRKMGISENDMEIVSENLDPKLKEFADWVQEEFLVSRRNKYNDVHKRIFGAPMAAIENYFPLRILQNARVQKVDVAQEQNEGVMPTTITGGIIKRKRNGLPLDILNTNAVSVLLDHIQEMEHWAAFAEFNRDLNTLLSYKKFKNKVLNMNSIYGSGKTLWRNLRDVCAMVGGSYRPPVATADKFAVNIAKGVSTAKVSFRLFTALKQLTSMPAFVADANMLYLAKSIANPKNAWDWSMKELPLFRKRWESRMSGDPRLQKSDLDWNLWRSDFVLTTQRIGMSPNAFIDAITVAIGSYAIYKTKKRKYIRYGFPEEVAEKRAKQDAMILTNETQQSSESAFLSTIQVDRSWISVLFSVFRNASMSYTRKLFEAMRSLRNIANKNSNMIEFMQKQYERWGAENPDIAARNEFSSGIVSNLIMLAIFGYIMQFFWNSSSELPYLIFGDDEEEKKKALGRVAAQSLFGGIEGFTAGDVLSNAGTKLLDSDKVNWSDLSKDMPLTDDAMNMYRKLGNNNIAALNDIINIAVQSGIGVNPQTITDMVVAFIDASNGDLDLAREAEMCLLRVINCPQSQLDKIYIDELQMSGDKAAKLTPKQFAERYAKYKVMRNAPLTGWLYTDEQRDNMIANKGKNILTQSKKSFNDLTTKEVKGLKPYLEEYERTKTYLSKLNKLKKEDEDAYYEKLDQYADTPAYWHHEVIKQYNSEINELTNIFLSTRDKAEMDSCVNAMILLKRELLQSLESMDK